jgi:hypothetical protein
MWEVKNHTPFAAHGYFVRDQNGVEHWVVAMRATFDVSDGQLPVAATVQPEVKLVPDMHPDNPDEMLEEADFQPFRPQADIVLHGTATLPGGQAAPVIPVTLSVGKLSKTLHCAGHQHLTRARFKDTLSDPAPITSLPLSWQHAAGGNCHKTDALSDDNPLGAGWLADWAQLPRGEALTLPQITDPKAPVTADQPFPTPQGFGPLQPHWGPRRHLAGTFDQAWQDTRHPRLPTDFDPRFHHSVLPDQWADLVGGEAVEVINANLTGPLRVRLPQLIVEARTQIGPDRMHDRLRIVGITIDATAQTLAMIWNTAIPCNGRDTEVQGSTLRISQMSGVAT